MKLIDRILAISATSPEDLGFLETQHLAQGGPAKTDRP